MLRGHLWEATEEKVATWGNSGRSKTLRCKRCGIILVIDIPQLKFKWIYLFNDDDTWSHYLGLYTFKSKTSKEHNCSQRLIRKALM